MERGVAHRDGGFRTCRGRRHVETVADADVAWQPLGTTPVTAPRLPAVPLRLRVVKPGAPRSRSRRRARSTVHARGRVAMPSDMVRVAGNLRAQYGVGQITATVGSFDIDRFEVTNRQFKEFVGKVDTTTARSGPSPSRRAARRCLGGGHGAVRRPDRPARTVKLGGGRLCGRPWR